MSQMHWAADLIGRPYVDDGYGPEGFNCWGLVRWAFEHVHGVLLPIVAIDDASIDNSAAIREAIDASGWRPTDSCQPQADDIVLMTGLEGRHVGMMVEVSGSLFLLHCLERIGVCLQPLSELGRAGFRDFTFWRHQP